jgi:hypothetical protein
VSINDAGRLCVHAEPEDVFCAQCATDTLLELNNRVNELEYTKASLRARIAELEEINAKHILNRIEYEVAAIEERNALEERLAKAEKLADAVEFWAQETEGMKRMSEALEAFRAVSESQEEK